MSSAVLYRLHQYMLRTPQGLSRSAATDVRANFKIRLGLPPHVRRLLGTLARYTS